MTVAERYGYELDPITGVVTLHCEDGIRDVVTVVFDTPLQTNLVVTGIGRRPRCRRSRSRFPMPVQGLIINTYAGDDELIVDNSNGLVALPDFIQFNGGEGDDRLTLIGTTQVTSAVYSVGPNVDEGTVTHTVAGQPNVVQTVHFTGLEPVVDLVAGPLTVNATNGEQRH